MTDKQLKDKAIEIKGKKYVLVSDRMQYLSNNYEWRYDVLSDYQYYPESKTRVVKATLKVRDEKHEHYSEYNGLAQEIDWQGMVNKTSALENAETSARWRACAAFGCWIIDSIASVDEMNKAMSRAKSDEMVKDTPFTKPTFWEKEFLKFKEQSNRFSFDEAWKIIHEKYSVSTDMEHKVMDVYWVDGWALFN